MCVRGKSESRSRVIEKEEMNTENITSLSIVCFYSATRLEGERDDIDVGNCSSRYDGTVGDNIERESSLQDYPA